MKFAGLWGLGFYFLNARFCSEKHFWDEISFKLKNGQDSMASTYLYMPLDQIVVYFFLLKKTTHFAFFRGKRRRFKDNTNAFLALFGVHFSGPLLTIKLHVLP